MARLALVTCGPVVEVALEGALSTPPSCVRLAGVTRRSSLLLAAVDLLFEDAALAPGDLDEVVVTRGPGSFTGIRSGLATASGLAAAAGIRVRACSSLLAQAARVTVPGQVWTAQPGRRGEVYAQAFSVDAEGVPHEDSPIEILSVDRLATRGPWLGPPRLVLPGVRPAAANRSAAEALLVLAELGLAAETVEAIYVEGPPIGAGGGEG